MKPLITEPDTLKKELFRFVSDCYPICRSITGHGVRKTLALVKKIIPLRQYEVPSGTKVFDWEVPDEWNIEQAYIKDPAGNTVVDYKNLNLHVVGYSIPVHAKMPLSELKKHIFTIPDRPDWVPYRTSYYNRTWGFCMSHNQVAELTEGEYEVVIDSTLKKGHLTYGEFFIPGKTKEEVLISTHVCHPSLCNDNLSGISISAFLAKILSAQTLKYSYRFLFIPATIGAITWLCLNESRLENIKHGLVITLLGDSSDFTYKKSRKGNTEIDAAVEYYLNFEKKSGKVIDFVPYGYDERQFCSPAFDLPVGCLTRTPYGEFPEYHTSGDNLEFISEEKLLESLTALLDIICVLENNETYINQNPKCEPMLGKRGLYEHIGGSNESKEIQLAALWVLNLSDGTTSLLDISRKSGIHFNLVKKSANALVKCNLLKEIPGPKSHVQH